MNEDTSFNLFQEGLRSYIEALAAIRGFYREVYSVSKAVLEDNFEDLGRNLRRKLERDWIEPYVSPAGRDLLDRWDGNWAWVAARLSAGDLCYGYFGLHWRGEDGQPPTAWAVVDFQIHNGALFRALSQQFRDLAGERIIPYRPYKELMIWEPIGPGNASSFSDKLDSVTKEWIGLWGRIQPDALPTPPRGG
jgi:hypothetical protein